MCYFLGTAKGQLYTIALCIDLSCSIITVKVHSVQYGTPGLIEFSLKFYHNYTSKGDRLWKTVFAISSSQIAAKALLLKIQEITCSLICVILSLVLKLSCTLEFVTKIFFCFVECFTLVELPKDDLLELVH